MFCCLTKKERKKMSKRKRDKKGWYFSEEMGFDWGPEGPPKKESTSIQESAPEEPSDPDGELPWEQQDV